MGWRAESGFLNLNVATLLTVSFAPYIHGRSPPAMKLGDQMLITLGISHPVEATIIGVSDDKLSFEMPDGSRWRATPKNENDIPFGSVIVPGQSRDWVVRAKMG